MKNKITPTHLKYTVAFGDIKIFINGTSFIQKSYGEQTRTLTTDAGVHNGWLMRAMAYLPVEQIICRKIFYTSSRNPDFEVFEKMHN